MHLDHLADLFRQSGDLALAICQGLASYVLEANRSASLSFVSLDNFRDIAGVHALIPANIALHCQALAVEKDGDRVKVALVNPSDQTSRHFLKNVLRAFRVEFVATSQRDFERFSRMYLRPEAGDNRSSPPAEKLEILYVTPEGGEQSISPQEIGPVLADIFDQAVRLRASDLHLEPGSPAARVRVRVDGSMLTLDRTVPIRQFLQVVSRIKVMAGMDITVKRLPQDGRFPILAGGRPLEIRASILPCQGGEKVVLRFLDPEQQFTEFDSLVSSKPLAHLFRDLFLSPSGLVLVCGPTGSGKTTTLYAGINEIWRSSPTYNILTVEDPVEYQVPFATQVPVNRAVGLDFAHILRTVLRQDPDILLVGEIRDTESAIIALEAATTGHLVLSSLHTDTALETIGRLINLNCKPTLITPAECCAASSARSLVSASVRAGARGGPAADDPQIAALRRRGIWPDQAPQPPRRGQGCAACRFKGEIGRLALFDVLCVDETLRNLIDQDMPVEKLRGRALKSCTTTCRALSTPGMRWSRGSWRRSESSSRSRRRTSRGVCKIGSRRAVYNCERVATFDGACHEPTRQGPLHREDSHHRRAGQRVAHFRRTSRRETGDPSSAGGGTNPEQLFRRRLVGLLPSARPAASSRPEEGPSAAGPGHRRGKSIWQGR